MIAGSCLCGQVKYELIAEGIFINNCHCPDCRKTSGSAYGTFLQTGLELFTWAEGQDLVRQYETAPGHGRAFCSVCGSSVPAVMEESQWVIIPAGTLDDDPGLRPVANLYADFKAPWHTITDGLPEFEEQAPEDFWNPHIELFLAGIKKKNK